jgi:hypothetical protein
MPPDQKSSVPPPWKRNIFGHPPVDDRHSFDDICHVLHEGEMKNKLGRQEIDALCAVKLSVRITLNSSGMDGECNLKIIIRTVRFKTLPLT